MRLILVILLSAAFVLNLVILKWAYPTLETDAVVWEKFDNTRHLVYAFMFAGFFWLTFLLSGKATVIKAISCCFTFLAFGSAIDKCFGIRTYLKSDILLIIISIAISVYVFIRERKSRG
jgi:hypothetical protein